MSERVDRETGEVAYLPPNMPPDIAAAIDAVKQSIGQLGFDERNQHAGYNYASVDKFYAAVRPLEASAGLFVILDETNVDIQQSARTDARTTAWAYINYDVWVATKSGAMWGPLRRHWIGPMTGPQTLGAAESYVRKAFMRGLYMVPTGEKDADDIAPRDDVPSKAATRTARPAPTATQNATSAVTSPGPSSAGNGAAADGARPKWISEFLTRESYQADHRKVGWSAWERNYLQIAATADNLDQLYKMDDDNKAELEEFAKAVQPAVYNNFRAQIEENHKRLLRQTGVVA